MKKVILSVVALASMVFSASAVTNMCVEQEDGTIVRYDVENVKQVYYEENAPEDTLISENMDTTQDVQDKIGNYPYVDLGLPSGLKWATYNVGANSLTEYGDYFAWGETSPKASYDEDNYKFRNNETGKYTKYVMDCPFADFGTEDSLLTLFSEDDAATANWGSNWRMPTVFEQQELIEGCDWVWTDNFYGSGIAGRIGTSKTNGNTIFLPASGFISGSNLQADGFLHFSLASTLYAPISNASSCLYFTKETIYVSADYRYNGHCVRAVLKEEGVGINLLSDFKKN